MKKSIILTMIVALLSFADGNAQKNETDHFTVEIHGMGCPYCAFGVEDEFSKLDGISDIEIDIKKGMLAFSVPAEMDLSIQKVEEKVSAAGYTPIQTQVVRADGTTKKSEKKSVATESSAKAKTETFKVAGECEMCKGRIEKAAKGVSGVSKAKWDVDTKMLSVSFDLEQTSTKKIQKAIAEVGHDTKAFKADDETYNKLHACCHYERMK